MKKLLILLIGIFMLSSVCALGVTPARTTMDFEPGLTREISFEIVNSGGQNLNLKLSPEGELSRYISNFPAEISISSSEASKKVSYTINLPNDLEPGLREGGILISEVPKADVSGESYIQATLAVAIQLHVYVPYPGKYANAKLYAYNADQGDDVRFVIPVASVGEFDLTSVKAQIDIYSKANEKIDSFYTNEVSIPSGQRKELVYNWEADVPIGGYIAKASLIYDDGTISLEDTFNVGSQELELQDVQVGDFTLGQIAKLEMLVENKWSEPISNAFVQTKIKNAAGNIVSSFESTTYDIAALSKQVFVSYWDTAGVKVGTYDAEVSIKYGDKTSTRNLEFQVEENELTVVGLGYVVSADGGEGESSALVVALIVIIVVLVLINLLWFFLLRKRLKK